jgi:hypothetical protein
MDAGADAETTQKVFDAASTQKSDVPSQSCAQGPRCLRGKAASVPSNWLSTVQHLVKSHNDSLSCISAHEMDNVYLPQVVMH